MTALSALDLPVAQNVYTGAETTFLTFNFDVYPRAYRDDLPTAEHYAAQAHLYAPHDTDTTALRARIIAALTGAGFPRPSVLNIADEYAQHLVFEFGDEEVI